MNARVTDTGPLMSRAAKNGCGCGAACQCESRCCDLECLVRPNFFCGQLLTDTDLGAMVEWTRQRLALARYRDGWGIACGLDVMCGDPDGETGCCGDKPGSGPAVYLSPGYAIDCCGNDLVVCAPMRIDLRPACTLPDDPCDPRSPPPPPPAAGTPTRGEEPSCFDLDIADAVAVRISLRYHEDLAQGQRAMFRSGCTETAACEYTRVLERPCVSLEMIPIDAKFGELPDEAQWIDDLKTATAAEVCRLMQLTSGGLEAVLQELRRHPPFQTCFLEDVVCCLLEQQKADKLANDWALKLMLRMYMDWLMRQLRCDCWSCRPDTGVPLATVLLRRTVVDGKARCRVVGIGTRGSHRRLLRKDSCRPLTQGMIDLTPFLMESAKSLQGRLRSMGMSMNTTEVLDTNDTVGRDAVAARDPSALKWLQQAIGQQVFAVDASFDGTLTALVAPDELGTQRVLAFVTTPA